MQLYNKLSAAEELIREAASGSRFFLSVCPYQGSQMYLEITWHLTLEVLGRIYVAHEGINAQFSIPADRFDEFKKP
jgi:UPF0176 protein